MLYRSPDAFYEHLITVVVPLLCTTATQKKFLYYTLVAAQIASLSMWDKSCSQAKLFPGSLSVISLSILVRSVALCLLSSISCFQMKVVVSVTKSLHQDRGPCYLHLPIFFLIHALAPRKLVLLSTTCFCWSSCWSTCQSSCCCCCYCCDLESCCNKKLFWLLFSTVY